MYCNKKPHTRLCGFLHGRSTFRNLGTLYCFTIFCTVISTLFWLYTAARYVPLSYPASDKANWFGPLPKLWLLTANCFPEISITTTRAIQSFTALIWSVTLPGVGFGVTLAEVMYCCTS